MQYEKIYNCKDDAEAAVILGMLSASGITGMSRDVKQGDILNVMSGTTLYGKEICDPKEDVGRARGLMLEMLVETSIFFYLAGSVKIGSLKSLWNEA